MPQPKPNIFLMTGDDPFTLREELSRWKEAFIEKYGDTDLAELDGETTPIEEMAGAFSTLPFLSEKRLVILKNFLSTQKAESANRLPPLLEKIPESTVLVLAEFGSPDQRIAAFKAVSGLATKRLFLKPKGAQLATWIQRRAEASAYGRAEASAYGRAEAQGALLSADAASYLASLLGDNLFALESEIQKLSLLAKGKNITAEMIDDTVTRSVQKSIFTLTDQLARKDFSGVLTTLRQLQDQGEEAGYIFSMITRQFRLMLEMRALAEENLPPAMIARKMEVHPFVVQNTLRFAKNFTAGEMKTALGKFLDLDRRLKTGLIPLKPREEDQYLLAIEKILIAQ